MPKVKIPRKSTAVDMTAMCDVAFLLLSFFILATKQKPPEVLAVVTPNSVSTKVAPDKAIMITMTQDGKAFLDFGEDTKKDEVLANINQTQNLGLSQAELTRWGKQQFIGQPLGSIKSSLASSREMNPATMPGIPTDTAKNEMTVWLRSVSNVYAGTDQSALQEILLVKGDTKTLYPTFKNIKKAFKENEIFKFKIVTNGEAAPPGTALAEEKNS